ncbi:transporter [Brevibacterium sp. 5221]|uniref:Transporter n=1 Tax=Brevibacterium rongguiense TaxID=2695267 RepID=A0A6N9H9R5_9MICO|nr:magnesium and cobalt transport protein CorA [Brevibacterium rongguiense]MYM20264.1 transporter [Brevibacterium rongguiense]
MAHPRYPYRHSAPDRIMGHADMFVLYDGSTVAADMKSIDAAADAFDAAVAHPDSHAFLWIDLLQPSHEDLDELASRFGLHPLAVEDAIEAHQRPKFERYGATDFMVLRPAALTINKRPADGEDPARPDFSVEVGETHAFIGDRFLIVIRHSPQDDDAKVRAAFEADPRFAAFPQFSALYRVLDHVVDCYGPIIRMLEDFSDSLEEQIFTGTPARSKDVFQLSRGIIEVERAVSPLTDLMAALFAMLKEQGAPDELMRGMRDVADHVRASAEHLERLRSLLREIFTVNATMISERQNEDMRRMNELSIQQNEQMKKISAWAAMLFFPSLVAGTYGMNFEHMPELHWALGYPFAIALMVAGCAVLWRIFKKVGWL